ncbi:MAG TPA: hypothetical protein VEF04_08525 [Blastocatellia bacterium]|nr:hypothetical protein [Blastocatellia bacterium]
MKFFTEKVSCAFLCTALLIISSNCAVRRGASDVATQAAAPVSSNSSEHAKGSATTPASPSHPQAHGLTTPASRPLVSYLKDGSLWAARDDGSEKRQLIAAPEEKSITHHVWSHDGQRIYFNVGINLYAYRVKEQKVDPLSVLPALATETVDQLEIAREGDTVIVRTIDQNNVLGAPPKLYAIDVAQNKARELTVDEYSTLTLARPAVVHAVNELSVSPDGKAILFWEVVGTEEQLFVSNAETGARCQLTELAQLDGFDPTASPDNVRRLIEATWSPDGQHIVFIPAQSCSETGICFGRMYLINRWGGPALQLAVDMTTNLSAEWNRTGTMLVYDDQGQILVSDIHGQIKPIAEGNQPRWQPI